MKEQNNIEKELNSLFKEVGKHQPSDNFTSSILNNLNPKLISEKAYYQPLISKRAWSLIILIVISVLIYAYTSLSL